MTVLSCRDRVRSPNPTPTHVWRLEGPKRTSSGTKLLIFHCTCCKIWGAKCDLLCFPLALCVNVTFYVRLDFFVNYSFNCFFVRIGSNSVCGSPPPFPARDNIYFHLLFKSKPTIKHTFQAPFVTLNHDFRSISFTAFDSHAPEAVGASF